MSLVSDTFPAWPHDCCGDHREYCPLFLNRTIHDVFSAVAALSPQSIALAGDGEPVTYGNLAQRSDRIARYLQGRGIGPGARVGLYAHRSTDSITAMLGILKAGAAYVPFDPTYPQKLLKFIYEDCAPSSFLVQRSLLAQHTESRFWEGETIDIHEEFVPAESTGGNLPVVGQDALAYIMYTSGSTGRPKGVLVPHRGVVRLVSDGSFADMDASQVHLQLAPLAFDASTFEIWGALLHGGKLAIEPKPYPSLDDISQAIQEHQVTTLWLTAGLFHLMVDRRLDGLKPLRQLLAGGDILSPSHVARALQALPHCQLINGYGPTENTTFTCCYRIPRDFVQTAAVPIGSAIRHTEVYVLDPAAKPVADGQEGELYAGGAGVALGYLNRPELTAERFLPNPFAAGGSSLMYRTGDRVRRRADGNIEFLGRLDRQVKISGKRVELDEIEACIRRSAMVDDGAVISPEASTGMRKVFAYVKSMRDPATLIKELREFLRRELPEHMLPASIFVLDTWPLSRNGKVDRGKLPQPGSFHAPRTADPLQPGSLIEMNLVKIWCEVLGRDFVGIDDNFFDLGGTSLQLISVHATIREAMKIDITVIDLFEYPRISQLAAALVRRAAPASAVASGVLSAADRATRQQAAQARARSIARGNS